MFCSPSTIPTAGRYLSHTVIRELTFPLQLPGVWRAPPRSPADPRGWYPLTLPTARLLASSERDDRLKGISSYSQSCLDSSPIDHICPCVHHGSDTAATDMPTQHHTRSFMAPQIPSGAFFPVKGHFLWHLPALGHSITFSFQLWL